MPGSINRMRRFSLCRTSRPPAALRQISCFFVIALRYQAFAIRLFKRRIAINDSFTAVDGE